MVLIEVTIAKTWWIWSCTGCMQEPKNSSEVTTNSSLFFYRRVELHSQSFQLNNCWSFTRFSCNLNLSSCFPETSLILCLGYKFDIDFVIFFLIPSFLRQSVFAHALPSLSHSLSFWFPSSLSLSHSLSIGLEHSSFSPFLCTYSAN